MRLSGNGPTTNGSSSALGVLIPASNRAQGRLAPLWRLRNARRRGGRGDCLESPRQKILAAFPWNRRREQLPLHGSSISPIRRTPG